MHRFYFLFILFFKSIEGFHVQDESEDSAAEQEPCNTGCKNGGQCFLSAFCICPKGFSGRYCQEPLNEQCGPFSSMSTMEIDCVLCTCYNGIFMCDTLPIGLCRQKFQIFRTRSMRIARVLKILRDRFKNIRKFEPITKLNVPLYDSIGLVDLKGYRIVLNRSSTKSPSSFVSLLFCLFSIYWLK